MQRDAGGLGAADLERSLRLATRVSSGRERGFREVVAAVPLPNAAALTPWAREAGTAVTTFLCSAPSS